MGQQDPGPLSPSPATKFGRLAPSKRSCENPVANAEVLVVPPVVVGIWGAELCHKVFWQLLMLLMSLLLLWSSSPVVVVVVVRIVVGVVVVGVVFVVVAGA